jgi:2'-5' RNA ligase
MFLALPLPPPVRAAVAGLAQPLAGLAWTPAERLHLTLRFLGNVGEGQRERMIERLDLVRVEPFILPVEGVGALPPQRMPRVVFVGVGSAHPHLFQLRQRIDDAVLASGLPLDVRTFHPHITVARCGGAPEQATRRWLRLRRDFVAPPFRVEAFELYASELRREGAVHTLRRRFELRGPEK